MNEQFYPSGLIRPEYVKELFDQLITDDKDKLLRMIVKSEKDAVRRTLKGCGYDEVLNNIPLITIYNYLQSCDYQPEEKTEDKEKTYI